MGADHTTHTDPGFSPPCHPTGTMASPGKPSTLATWQALARPGKAWQALANPGKPWQGLKCGEAHQLTTNRRWRKSGREKANGDFPSIARTMTRGECALAQVQGLEQAGRWHGQWVQLANATTAEFLHTSDVIPQVRSPSGGVMKLCHFDATGFTPSKILSHPL